MIKTKIYKEDIAKVRYDKDVGMGKDHSTYYLTEHYELACCVCKIWNEVNEWFLSDIVYGPETVTLNGVLYIVSPHGRHDTCRELFLMNPMAYEND